MEFVQINEPRIKDYYKISKNGVIVSYFKPLYPVELKYRIDKDGYFTVSLQLKDGKRMSFLVHRLVALTFVENQLNLPVVNHKDTNKQNNFYKNLEWCTISENTQHAYDNNLINHGRKKKVKSINLVTGEIMIFDTIKMASEYYDKHFTDISKICNKKIKPYIKGKIANIDFEFYEE